MPLIAGPKNHQAFRAVTSPRTILVSAALHLALIVPLLMTAYIQPAEAPEANQIHVEMVSEAPALSGNPGPETLAEPVAEPAALAAMTPTPPDDASMPMLHPEPSSLRVPDAPEPSQPDLARPEAVPPEPARAELAQPGTIPPPKLFQQTATPPPPAPPPKASPHRTHPQVQPRMQRDPRSTGTEAMTPQSPPNSEAKPMPPGGSPVGPGAGQGHPMAAAASPGWDGLIAAWLAAHKIYPDAARQMGQQGDVVIRFTIAADGRVLQAGIVQGSGASILDAAALRLFASAQLPAPLAPQTRIVRLRYRLE